jgi:hypothetical protein
MQDEMGTIFVIVVVMENGGQNNKLAKKTKCGKAEKQK